MTGSADGGPAPLLVLGVGNLLLCDDGVGLELLRRLAGEGVEGAEVELVDGGTQGLALLPYLDGRRALLILDAVSRGAPPGTVHVLDDPEPAAPDGPVLAPHGGNASDLLNAARLLGALPARVVVVGVEPALVRTGTELSPEVQAALPEALSAVRQSVRRLARGRVEVAVPGPVR